MPRISNNTYLKTHNLLRRQWLEGKPAFGVLGLEQQRILHDYFRPSEELTRDELLTHRRAISAAHPTLPNRAGKALRHLQRMPAVEQPRTPAGSRQVRIYPVLKPEPDVDGIVMAVMRLREDLQREEAE